MTAAAADTIVALNVADEALSAAAAAFYARAVADAEAVDYQCWNLLSTALKYLHAAQVAAGALEPPTIT